MRPLRLNGLATAMAAVLLLVAGACAATPAPLPQPPAGAEAQPIDRAEPGGGEAGSGRGSLVHPLEVTQPPPPASTPPPSPTPIPTWTPVAGPQARLQRLTDGACCVQPFWSADGSAVGFLDRPAADAPVGIYAVAVEGGGPRLVTERLGNYSPDGRFVIYPDGGRTYIEALEGGERWASPSGHRPAAFTPDDEHVWWQETVRDSEDFGQRVIDVWIARPDGSESRRVARLTGGGVSDWFPSGDRLLLSWREGAGRESVLSALDLRDGASIELARAYRIRSATLSPDGLWVAYQVTFSEDASLDGMWLASTDGTGSRRLAIFGAYRWRPGGGLLVVPLEAHPETGSHRVVEVDPSSGQVTELTDPSELRFRIAGGDWAVSPDGRRIAFVSAPDRSIWVLELPAASSLAP